MLIFTFKKADKMHECRLLAATPTSEIANFEAFFAKYSILSKSEKASLIIFKGTKAASNNKGSIISSFCFFSSSVLVGKE